MSSLYVTYTVICDVFKSLAVFEAAIWVKSKRIWWNPVWKPETKSKYGNKRYFYI